MAMQDSCSIIQDVALFGNEPSYQVMKKDKSYSKIDVTINVII